MIKSFQQQLIQKIDSFQNELLNFKNLDNPTGEWLIEKPPKTL